MRGVLTIAGATLRRSIRNRSFLVLGLLAPFLIMAALSLTIGDALAGEFRPSLGIVDESGRGDAEAIAAGLADSGFDDVVVLRDAETARTDVADGTLDAAIVISAGADRPTTTVLVDAQNEISAEIATSIATEIGRSGRVDVVLASLGVFAPDTTVPIEMVATNDIGSSVLTDSTYFAVGMSAFFAFFAASGFMAGHHRDRSESTLARVLVSPIGRFAPMLGRGLGVGVLTAISFTVLVATSTLFLGADWGPTGGVLIVGSALVFTSIAVSAAVVAVTKSEESASQIGMVIATAWAVFGGVFVELPRSGLLALGSRLSPFTWSLEAIGLNAGTGEFGDVVRRSVVIACFGMAALVVVAVRRAELGRP